MIESVSPRRTSVSAYVMQVGGLPDNSSRCGSDNTQNFEVELLHEGSGHRVQFTPNSCVAGDTSITFPTSRPPLEFDMNFDGSNPDEAELKLFLLRRTRESCETVAWVSLSRNLINDVTDSGVSRESSCIVNLLQPDTKKAFGTVRVRFLIRNPLKPLASPQQTLTGAADQARRDQESRAGYDAFLQREHEEMPHLPENALRVSWPYDAQSVEVCGSWDNWNHHVPLHRNVNGGWTGVVDVRGDNREGEFKFIVDGKWALDSHRECVSAEYNGGSVLNHRWTLGAPAV